MKFTFFDIETRSELDVTKVGAWAYAAHPSTAPLCISYKYSAFPIDRWLPKSTLYPHAFEDSECFYVAHNVEFEYCIWKFILHPRYGWPEPPPPERWVDSAAVARYYGYPGSLEKGSEAMGVGKKDMDGQRIMMKLSKPRRPSASNPDKYWTPETKPEDFDRLYEYCDKDVVQSFRIIKKLGVLPPREQEIWEHNFKLSIRGIPIDTDLARTVLDIKELHVNKINEELTRLTKGRITTATQHARFAKELELGSVARENLEAITKSVNWETMNGYHRRLIELRLEAGRTSTAKFETMLAQCLPDGRIHGQLIVNAATTGRYAGYGIQPHNMFRTKMKFRELVKIIRYLKSKHPIFDKYMWLRSQYDDIMAVFSNLIRQAIKAIDNSALVVCDYAAVEARVVGWLANDKTLMRLFRDFDKGEAVEPYCDMGEVIYGYPIDKNIHELERFLGKQTILGCGFGMGWRKFQITCAGYGVEISDELAQKAVTAYRTRFKKVKKSWYEIGDAVIRVIKHGVKIKLCRCTWELIHSPIRALRITLPSGKMLHFVNPTVSPGPAPWNTKQIIDKIYYYGISSKTHQWGKIETHGASLLETITQAVAAELLKATLLELERRKMPVIFHVHDEPIAMVKKSKAQKALQVMTQVMESPPAWCQAPIKAEGKIMFRYRKA